MNEKPKSYYVWWHEDAAGTCSTWSECEGALNGKKGRQCKKYSDADSAEEAKEEKLKEIRLKKNTVNMKGKEMQTPTASSKDHGADDSQQRTLLENIEKRLESLQKFEETQIALNDQFERSITDETMRLNNFGERMEDLDLRANHKLKDMLIEFDQRLETTKENLKQEFAGQIKRLKRVVNKLQNDTSAIKKNLKIVMKRIEDFYADVAIISENPDEDRESENPNLTTNISTSTVETYNMFEVLSNEPTTPTTKPSENTETREVHRPRHTTPSETPLTQNNNENNTSKGPILILADSMLRGIKQTLLTRDRYVNKQIVHGGIAEAISHVTNMSDQTSYEEVIIHLGTNDVNTKHKLTTLDEMLQLISITRSKWPNCRVLISGVIEHRLDQEKNRNITELNGDLKDITKRLENCNFIDNSKITRTRDGRINERIFYDDIHLNNFTGTRILAANLKDALGLRLSSSKQQPSEERRHYPRYSRYDQPMAAGRYPSEHIQRQANERDRQVGDRPQLQTPNQSRHQFQGPSHRSPDDSLNMIPVSALVHWLDSLALNNSNLKAGIGSRQYGNSHYRDSYYAGQY